MRYEWAEGRGRSISAQTVGDEIDRIVALHGTCTPPLFVKTASDPSSPLHNLLEWDDTKAAESHRLHQSRMVINSVDVVINEADPIRVQAFISIKEGVSRHYVAHAMIASDDDLYSQVVDELNGIINTYRRKLAGFERFRQLVQAIDNAA